METITEDGEVIEGTDLVAFQQTSMAVQLQKAEIDQLVATAHAFPRSLKRVQSSILSMATLDEESAEECMYALPRGGKPIKGPSIRFAEILKQSYGNCQSAARVVHVDRAEKYVEAEGVFIDLETNSKSTARVRRRISDKKGRVFNDDMIIVTGNAACAIAMRNAILAGVPKPLWRRAYESVQATITGDITTLSVNREKAFKALAAFGVKPEQVFQALGVEGAEDIGVDHIATLRGMYAALKNGEATVEEMFVGTVKAASDHQQVADPLSDDPSPKTNTQSPDVAAASASGEGRTDGNVGAATNSSSTQAIPQASDGAGMSPADTQAASGAPSSDAAVPSDPASSQGTETGGGKTPAADPPADRSSPTNPAGGSPLMDEAYEDGRNAKVASKSRKAIPAKFRANPETWESWLTGFDESPDDD